MIDRALGLAFRKLGRHYPRVVLFVLFQAAHLVVLGGICLLELYLPDLTKGEFLRLGGAALVLVMVENVVSMRMIRCLLATPVAWLKGQRDPETTVEAWRALVNLPWAYTRRIAKPTILFTVFTWCVYAAWELELPFYSVGLFMAGGLVTLAYGLTLRYLGMEQALRPVTAEVSRHLPDGADLPGAGVPLRWKLLAGLPIINIVTGVVVSGLSTDGTATLKELGVDVVVAVIVAFTVSLGLTLLLSRSILGPLRELRDATARVGAGDFGARVSILSTDEMGALARAFNDTVAGLQEREKLREAFGAFVDPEVAERVMREGTVLEGDEVEVSVLFLDIRDFTAFAEQASAREVVTRLNGFYEEVVPVLLRHGGHANKFVGDGLLAVFGAPERQPDHADRAVAAALEIGGLVEERYGEDLRIGIGVNSGPVVAGTIGGGGRVEFTVIGDPVNTASRVEKATRETGDAVLITEQTRCLLTHDDFQLQERDPVPLKGKSEEVRLWAPAVPAPGAAVALPTPDRVAG